MGKVLAEFTVALLMRLPYSNHFSIVRGCGVFRIPGRLGLFVDFPFPGLLLPFSHVFGRPVWVPTILPLPPRR